MKLRLHDDAEPSPPATIRIKMVGIRQHRPGHRVVILKGQVNDLAHPPFQRLNAHLVVTDGSLETTIVVQNDFIFTVEWLLGQRDVEHIAVLYYQPTPGTLVLESIHMAHN